MVSQTIYIFPFAIGHTSPKGLGIANRGDAPKTHAIQWGIWFWLMWNIIGIIARNRLLNFLGGDNLENVWKPCLKDCY